MKDITGAKVVTCLIDNQDGTLDRLIVKKNGAFFEVGACQHLDQDCALYIKAYKPISLEIVYPTRIIKDKGDE